jgi:tetratricopeptide (TPR) repeat protein
MPSCRVRVRFVLAILALCVAVFPSISCSGPAARPLLPRSQTWAELRTIRRDVLVQPPGEALRAPYARERLVDGEGVQVAAEGLAWLRRDGGATLLVRGPAELTLRADAVEIGSGRVFVDTPSGFTTEIATPGGPLHLAHVRASIDVGKAATEVYVLAGEVRTESAGPAGGTAAAGERLTISGAGKEARASVVPVLSWEDWTGGLATTDRAAEPAPYGVGTVGARRAGDQGSPRFPLSIQRLDVRVRIDRDFALTEVDEVFFNPSSEVVEGLYRFRTPDGAVLHRFGVDRDGAVMWGRVKEKQAAAAQYQAHVYQGSTEDPALLEWDAPGVYRARLYPIGPGETRRVVVTYAEWLGRSGPRRDRRLYVYPMAAEGAEESLPHIEELYATLDLTSAGAADVRAGMAAVREGDVLVVRDHDLIPRADLSVELFDDGLPIWRGYQAPHAVDLQTLPPAERAEATRRAHTEADYVLVPVPETGAAGGEKSGLDLSIVIDTSAATEPAALAVARAATGALLAHLGQADRAVVWAGDAVLRPVVPGKDRLGVLDEAGRRAVLEHLATIERGGATDLGAMLAAAAQSLDPAPARRGAVVYVGDGAATVGELSLVDLQSRLAKLPRPVRIFALGVGDAADMGILGGLARGAFAERIGDANAAARAALRLLEVAERPARLGASVDLGPSVERVFPRDLGALVEGEGLVVVGRLAGAAPTSFTVKSAAGATSLPLKVNVLDDGGDLSRRWAQGRLAQMIDEGVGRAAMVDLGTRHGIITPVTSLYVPTKNEMTPEERTELARRRGEHRTWRAAQKTAGKYERHDAQKEDEAESTITVSADNKEGGTGTRAKGEEGSMGNPHSSSPAHRYAMQAGGAAVVATPPPAATAAVVDGYMELPAATAAPSAAGAAAEVPRGPRLAREAAKSAEAAPGGGKDADKARAIDTASQFGMIGLLNGQAGDLSPTEGKPAADPGFASDGEVMIPEVSGLAWGGNTGDSGGLGAIGTIGHGAGGGGRGQEIGLGNADGNGNGNGKLDRKLRLDRVDQTAPAGAVAKNLAGKDIPAYRSRAVEVTVRLGDVGHFALRCGGAAALPFEERIALWRERLAAVTGNAQAIAGVYHRSLAACEAPTWRERARLLSMLLDAMPSVPGKVALWRAMFHDLGASDTLYRGILARVRTPAELRLLHDALGLKSIDPGVLAKIIKDAKTPGDRVTRLRGLVLVWSDDFALALKLLDALEDAGDDAGARELARKLRGRPDADARVRTAVGELYLRMAAREKDRNAAQALLDEGEARRAFGEIVEFAPDDPIARRRIGDLLRAHGWYAEAARQYETLKRLAPDDAGVDLLLAAAAEGLGKLEEAVKWTEKGGAAGAPDAAEGPARTARAFAATWLAWGRLDALNDKRADEASALAARLARVRSTERLSGEALKGTRVALSWAHPELHPTLWTNALGAPMPAPEGDVTLGIAAATLPVRDSAFVEVRLEPDEVEHTARLGAEATLTVVFDEGGANEKIVKIPVRFAGGDRATKRFSLAGAAVKEVSP